MTYKLAGKKSARKEWDKLENTVRIQFKKKLAERLTHPHIPSAALHGAKNTYKIKLRQLGYRLIYCMDDNIVVTVIAVGRRDRNEVYDIALSRIGE